jgi:hypothetical protein
MVKKRGLDLSPKKEGSKPSKRKIFEGGVPTNRNCLAKTK